MNAGKIYAAATVVLTLGVVAAAYFLLSRPRYIYGDPEGEIPLVIPDNVDFYRGQRLFFCTNENCARSFLEQKLTEEQLRSMKCPSCQEADLSEISIGERKLLPDNTPIFRRVYKADTGPAIQTTFVFSGMERKSIHRPQVCLVAHGNKINDEYSYDVDIGGGRTITAKVLEISQTFKEPNGNQETIFSVYVYWFFNPEHITDSHLTRFMYMMYDNAVHNYRPRWAYVSLCMERDPNHPDNWKSAINDFVPRLYPVIETLRKDLGRNRSVKKLY